MRALLLVVTAAAAACGSNTRSTSKPITNRAAPPPKPLCTAAHQRSLATLLAARWNTPAITFVRCTPGLFPMPGFFVELDCGDNTPHRAGIVSADNKLEVSEFDIEDSRMPTTSIIDTATVDLDGDGTDEIVETWRKTSYSRIGSDSWLTIRRLDTAAAAAADRHLAIIRGPHTSVYHPDLGGCSAEVRLAGKTIVITVEDSTGIPPSDCLTAGTHTFALEGGAIVEISARISRR
jgi:hypothetical protein